jgi:hypothetical protein
MPTDEQRKPPNLLTADEASDILKDAERLWSALEGNQLGGYSGRNRPFYILHEFKAVLEKYGRRDVGLSWSKNDLDALTAKPEAVKTTWQPIETAPKDGTKVDLWVNFQRSGWGRVADAYWNDEVRDWQLGGFNAVEYDVRPEISHWMPSPSGPRLPMNERKQALVELRDKIKAGCSPLNIEKAARKVWPLDASGMNYLGVYAKCALDGSLDSAKFLHEKLLPGVSQYSIITDPTCICVKVCWWPEGLSNHSHCFNGEGWDEGPARAWLIAILEALIAREE